MLTQIAPERPKLNTPPMVKKFLDYLFVECGLAGNTVTAYQRDLIEFWNHVIAARETIVAHLTMTDIQAHLMALQARGLSPSSIARHLSAIKMFLRFAYGEHLIRRNVAALIETPRKWRRLPESLHQTQIEALLGAPDPTDDYYLRDKALLELLYAAGLRASEAAGLELSQINFKVGYLRCVGKGKKERIIPINQSALHALENYIDDLRPQLCSPRSTEAVFLSRTGRPLDRTSVWRLVNKYGKISGINKRVYPHLMRHCFATHLLSGGADLRVIQELLGHSSVLSTQLYTHLDLKGLKMVHQKYHPRP